MASMIEDLMKPSAFPENPESVELVQTHISYVFVGDEFVYKIKKPVNFGFLDFSTLEKRKHYCEQEVELNSRFSKDVYLGVYPVTFNGTEHRIGGTGDVVEFAVKMRRLPDEELMKSRFASGRLSDEDINRIARTIASFHKNTNRSAEIDKFGEISSVRFNVDECFEQTEQYIGDSITEEQFNAIKNWCENFYAEKKALFESRIKNGKIRDCHGDLHMEHICLTDPIVIFDCIEFNERFRYSDVASDIAFLLMDLEFNGGFDLAEKLYTNYIEHAEEEDIAELVSFYKIYRAYVRGKVNSFLLSDPAVSEDKKVIARNTARKYFELAFSYVNK
jgi:aminoglycoside phosphotransferase family enzyme